MFSALGSHTGPETMSSFAFDDAWLKGSFHFNSWKSRTIYLLALPPKPQGYSVGW